MESKKPNRSVSLLLVAVAAFSTYFCMYAFRKPFSAGVFEGAEIGEWAFKSTIVLSQLLGYMLSKFIGIKVVSEMKPGRRIWTILGLIGFAELALIGFACVPLPWKILMMFLNGLPLGIIFGLVLSFLEGRRQTEALSAALCASFIMSSGVVKSVGRWLVENQGISEFVMPMLVGLLFVPPLLIAVWLLSLTPPPDASDIAVRAERPAMTGTQRREFLRAYWPGLFGLVLVYVLLTTIRTARDDFGVEIWRDLGVSEEPAVYATSETIVAIFASAANALAIFVLNNLRAIRLAIGLMCLSFGLVFVVALGQANSWLSPMVFMVGCGVGLYVPYVAFHTTIFERLVAASRRPGNLGFLMYFADALGYLGYASVLVAKNFVDRESEILGSFQMLLVAGSTLALMALLGSLIYFEIRLREPATEEARLSSTSTPVTG